MTDELKPMVRAFAGRLEWYPDIEDLIDTVVSEFGDEYSPQETLHIIRDVFTALTRADISGYISAGDEHEWATIALRANERARNNTAGGNNEG